MVRYGARFAGALLLCCAHLAACGAHPADPATTAAPDTAAFADTAAPADAAATPDAGAELAGAGETSPADVAPDDAATTADALSDAPAADATTADVAVADAETAPADAVVAPSTTTFAITASMPLGAGKLHIRLMDQTVPGCEPTPADVIVSDGTTTLPATFTVVVPNGIWLPAAAWLDDNGKVTATSMKGNTLGPITVLPGVPAPKQIALDINTSAADSECQAPTANAFMTAASAYMIPFTNVGVSHLLEGLAWNGKWWMAANVEGIGVVDLPSKGKGVGGWTEFSVGDCRHIARDQARLFCTERSNGVLWLDIDPATNQPTQKGALPLPVGVHAEGIASVGGALFVALHEAGVAYVAPGSQTATVQGQGLVVDAWHVAVLADGKLVVADGRAGLKVLAPLQDGPTSVVSSLALPGLSAHLAVSGNTIAVGALGGGLHLVRVDAAGQLTLLGTLPAGPWPFVGVDIAGDVAYVAVGRALLAVPVPAKPVGLLSAVSATLTESFMSLDVRAEGGLALTAEYAYVRALQLDPAPPAPGVVVVNEEETWGKSALKGQGVKFTVWLWNAGSQPLQISKFLLSTMTMAPLPPTGYTAPKSLEIAPGASVQFDVTVVKTAPGPQQWRLDVATNDVARPWATTRLTESPLKHEGEALPVLEYKDALGALQSVKTLAKGKPLLLLVAPETCPVAFERAAAISAQVLPYLQSGKLSVVNVNPWDGPTQKEVGGFKMPFPELFTTMTEPKIGESSKLADELLPLPGLGPIPPFPLVFVVDAQGVITYGHLGYAPAPLQAAIEAVLK